jgi:hypothetical protein
MKVIFGGFALRMSSNADQRIEPQKVIGLRGAEQNFFGPGADSDHETES